MRTECPKCHSQHARYEQTTHDVVLRCLCGLYKIVQSRLDNVTVEHIDSAEFISLPRRGTKLWNCLAMLIGLEKADLHTVTFRLNLSASGDMSASDVASQLTVLRYKGLARPMEAKSDGRSLKRGIPGGSTWIPTEAAMRLFKGVK